MSIKIIRTKTHAAPMVFGIERLPKSWQAPAQRLIEDYADLLTAYKPHSLDDIAKRIRQQSTTTQHEVDAGLFDDFHKAAVENKPGLGATLYRLEDFMLPV